MSYEFQNKVVLITGAMGGIGKALGHAFSSQGANVIYSDQNTLPENLHDIQADNYIKMDISKEANRC